MRAALREREEPPPACPRRRPSPSESLAEGRMGAQLDRRRMTARPLGFTNRLECQLALLAVQPINEQDAIEVVGLVLDTPGQQLAALDGHRFAVHVHALGDDTHRTLGGEREARNGESALVAVLLLIGQVEYGVHEVPEDIVNPVREHAKAHAELWS